MIILRNPQIAELIEAGQNGGCHVCFSSGLDKVETGCNLLME